VLDQMSGVLSSHTWAFVVAHPGHELRAFHFLERTRPLVSVLTDGSGSQGTSRLRDTTRVLDEAGATRDKVYGCFSDPQAYSHIMARDESRFVEVAQRLSQSFEHGGITAVLTDAAEGYNPVHDVCRGIAEAAVRLCGARAPVLFEVDLVGHPNGSGPGIRLTLDEAAFARKLDAIGRYTALAAEATAAFDLYGTEAFRVEFLRRSTIGALASPDHVPYYEQVGNARVQQGTYGSVLRYGAHVQPVLAALSALARRPLPDGQPLAQERHPV
jgi:hypothetical protein